MNFSRFPNETSCFGLVPRRDDLLVARGTSSLPLPQRKSKTDAGLTIILINQALAKAVKDWRVAVDRMRNREIPTQLQGDILPFVCRLSVQCMHLGEFLRAQFCLQKTFRNAVLT